MKECIYRVLGEKSKSEGENVSGTLNQAIEEITGGDFVAVAYTEVLSQTFENGLCSIRTVYDGGPMECRQPNCDQETCPDITDLPQQ